MQNRLFEQIKQRLPITEVLSTYITLEPSGTQFKARCPFHNEKTASFSVSPERGLFYCFGCGAKGDIFNFVEQFEGLDKKGALKVLADRAGIEMTASNATTADATDGVYGALETAAQKYQSVLKNHPEALQYLKDRGVTEETIEQFRIGYAPTEWRTLSGSLDQKSQDYYERAGLIKKTEKGYYDRFRGRIMFPLSDSSGRIVAFSGRIFPDSAQDIEQGPKYLNSPETELFQKSRVLFGFDKAKVAIKKHNFAILVEGQMDLILSHQAGFKNTVATSGTAVSESIIGDPSAQLSVIARLTPNIFFAFDGDEAGQKAMERAALVVLSLGMNPKVVMLPEGMDPADFLKENDPDQWKGSLKTAEHFIPHTLHAIQKKALSAHQLKQTFRDKLFPFLLRVSSAIERQVYLNTIASESNVGIKEVTDDFNTFAKEFTTREINAPEKDPVAHVLIPLTHAERFMALIELFPEPSITQHHTALSQFQFEDTALVLPILEGEHKARILAVTERAYATVPEEQREDIAKELSQAIIMQFLEQLQFEYAMKMNEAKQQKDDDKELHYLALLQKLHQRRHAP
jgi:DNA primase